MLSDHNKLEGSWPLYMRKGVTDMENNENCPKCLNGKSGRLNVSARGICTSRSPVGGYERGKIFAF